MANDTESTGFRAGLRGFGVLGLLAILIIFAGLAVSPPIAAVLVLLWVWVSKTPWREIGYVRPGSWVGGLIAGAVFGVALKIAMKAVVMPLLGAPPVNPTFHYLAGNLTAAAQFAAYVVVGAGFGEETFFRGYLFERLGKLLGPSAGAKIVIVLVTSALFGAAHYAQGLPGMEQAAIVGCIAATIFAVTGRIWFLIVTHAAFDLTAAAIIYFDAEEKVAHLLFR